MNRIPIVAMAVMIGLAAGGASATDSAKTLRRLQSADQHLTKISAKLDAINRGFAQPPEPDKPAFRVALDDIIAQGGKAVSLAQQMRAKIQ